MNLLNFLKNTWSIISEKKTVSEILKSKRRLPQIKSSDIYPRPSIFHQHRRIHHQYHPHLVDAQLHQSFHHQDVKHQNLHLISPHQQNHHIHLTPLKVPKVNESPEKFQKILQSYPVSTNFPKFNSYSLYQKPKPIDQSPKESTTPVYFPQSTSYLEFNQVKNLKLFNLILTSWMLGAK